jgi:hypothetical protein
VKYFSAKEFYILICTFSTLKSNFQTQISGKNVKIVKEESCTVLEDEDRRAAMLAANKVTVN